MPVGNAGLVTVTLSNVSMGPGNTVNSTIQNVRSMNIRFVDGIIDIFPDKPAGQNIQVQYSNLNDILVSPIDKTVVLVA